MASTKRTSSAKAADDSKAAAGAAATAKKAAAKSATPAKPAKKAAAKPKVPAAPAAPPPAFPDQAEIDRMIAEAAYYLAEKRNFQPGHEKEDWEAATAEVMAKLGGGA